MSDYSGDHTDALADVTENGADCPFTKTTPGVLDAATEQRGAPSTVTMAGKAIETEGDPKEYRDLGVTESNPATLFWVPSTIGSEPDPGMDNTWGGVTRSVKRVRRIAPNGTTIAAFVVVAT